MSDQGTQNVVRSSKRYAAFSKHCDPVFEAYALVQERGWGGCIKPVASYKQTFLAMEHSVT